jgi:hypothetical protein
MSDPANFGMAKRLMSGVRGLDGIPADRDAVEAMASRLNDLDPDEIDDLLISGDPDLVDVPPVRRPAAEEIAASAALTPVITQMGRLAEYCAAPGRTLIKKGNPRVADAMAPAWSRLDVPAKLDRVADAALLEGLTPGVWGYAAHEIADALDPNISSLLLSLVAAYGSGEPLEADDLCGALAEALLGPVETWMVRSQTWATRRVLTASNAAASSPDGRRGPGWTIPVSRYSTSPTRRPPRRRTCSRWSDGSIPNSGSGRPPRRRRGGATRLRSSSATPSPTRRARPRRCSRPCRHVSVTSG